jgi:hypothetical protein
MFLWCLFNEYQKRVRSWKYASSFSFLLEQGVIYWTMVAIIGTLCKLSFAIFILVSQVVSSDECTKAKKNFDAEVKTAIKSAAARLQRESRKNTGNSTSSQESFAVVGYDKNIPQPSGLTKLLKVLRPLAEGTEKGNAVPVNLRVALVMPEYLDWDVCWSRIEARDNSYLLNNCPPSVKGSMPPGECRKVFDNFYSLAKKWLPVAQDIAPEHAVVTPAFLPPSSTSSQGSDDGGRSACAQVIAELVGNFDQMSRRALSFADLDRAFQASEDKDAAGSSSMLGGGLGGGSLNGRAVWCSAPVDRTNLHLTLVPPPGSRESNETSRKDALDRMKAQHGKKVKRGGGTVGERDKEESIMTPQCILAHSFAHTHSCNTEIEMNGQEYFLIVCATQEDSSYRFFSLSLWPLLMNASDLHYSDQVSRRRLHPTGEVSPIWAEEPAWWKRRRRRWRVRFQARRSLGGGLGRRFDSRK